MKPRVLLCALAMATGAVFGQGHTLWQDGGVQLCGTSAWKVIAATSDSAGGAIVMWWDTRDGWDHYDIYAQRVDAAGVPQWTENGVRLRDSIYAGNLACTDDGRHGAITISGGGSFNAFAVQRISGDGVPLWGSDGVALRPPTDSMGEIPALVRDGHGGAIVAWCMSTIYTDVDTLIASRVDSSGAKRWEIIIRVSKVDGGPSLCPDGLGGAIMAWTENYGGPVRLQRIDGNGAIRWGPSGVLACTLSTTQYAGDCVAVGESCFVVGINAKVGGTWQSRAQRVDHAGDLRWSPAALQVSDDLGRFALAGDGEGQSVWVWSVDSAGTTDLFAQKLDSTGARCWDTTGVWLGTVDTSGGQLAVPTTDGRGGAIMAWTFYRDYQNWDIYAQHVDSAGHLCWSDTGLAVCHDTWSATYPLVVSDGAGGAIISWLDERGRYAQRVADGSGVAETQNAEVQATTFGPTVVRGVLFLPGTSIRELQDADLLDVSGRKVLTLRAGANDVRSLPPGVYVIEAGPGLRAKVVKLR